MQLNDKMRLYLEMPSPCLGVSLFAAQNNFGDGL
jgi:hypothetical protein